jgi:predicted nucleotidyltransferase
MNHVEHRAQQAQILERVLAILTGDSRVLGVVIAGSVARGENDAFSDLDVGCYLRDETQTERPELYAQVGRIAPTLCQLWIYDLNALYLFENGVRLDLDFMRPSALTAASYVYTDRQIAYDPDGALGRAFSAPHTSEPAAHPKYFAPGDPAMLDWFFWMFRQIVCWAKRGAQGRDRAFEKLASAMHSLDEVRTRLGEMRVWTAGRHDYLSRVDPECARRLAETYPRLRAEEIVTCAERLLDEYERIALAYCEKAGAVYPARKAQVTRQLLAEFARLA